MDHATFAAARMGSYELRRVRRALEAELMADAAAGVTGTQAHVGKLELLAAAGAELDKRGELLPPPDYIETDREDGVRLSFSVRVF